MKFVTASLIPLLSLGGPYITAVTADCNVDDHHPGNGGYFIEGVNGFASAKDPDSSHGAFLTNNTWAPGIEYPYGQGISCIGPQCSCIGRHDRPGGCKGVISGHTCSLLRFCPGDSGISSSIYLMPDFEATDTCDFSKAKLVGQTFAGPPETCHDYAFEEDHELKTYYFADKQGCSEGQRVAITIEDFDVTATQCKVIASGSSRIENCDCEFEKKSMTLTEPCRSAFVRTCLDNSPEDKSCCETESCVARDKDYTDPIGKEKEDKRREKCNDDVPGLCYNEDGKGTQTNRQGSTDCCHYVCSECGTELASSALWKSCTSSDHPDSDTAACGYLSRYDSADDPFICDFSKCDDRDHWNVEGDAYKSWINPRRRLRN